MTAKESEIAVSQRARDFASDFTSQIAARTRGERAAMMNGSADDDCFIKAFARFEAETLSDLPKIWTDPAGKGYPCQERTMTVEEVCEYVAKLEEEVQRLRAGLTRIANRPQGEPDTALNVVSELSLIARQALARQA